jgi:hypothetical protein
VAQTPPPAHWHGTIDLTIGGADVDDDASFGRTSGLAVDRSGRIFVADAQDNQVRMFSPAGVFLAHIGRMGSGPMEFKHLATITIGPDQLLWARDEGNARMLGIDVSATPPRAVRNVPLVPFTGGSQLAITFLPDGSLVDETIWFDKSIETFRPLRIRRTPAGIVSRTDTLPVPQGAFAGRHKITRVQKDAKGKQIGISQAYVLQPFGPEWIRAYGPGGVRADAVGSRYEVRIFDSNERLLRTIKQNAPPVALSAREKHISDSTLSGIKEQLPFSVPSVKAPVVGLMWTREGQLWIERAVADGRAREADVFDKDGRWIAIAEWPRNVDLRNGFPVIAGTTVTAMATDESDAERIVRLRFR